PLTLMTSLMLYSVSCSVCVFSFIALLPFTQVFYLLCCPASGPMESNITETCVVYYQFKSDLMQTGEANASPVLTKSIVEPLISVALNGPRSAGKRRPRLENDVRPC